jgi:putative drug exporter of the RND superfamily
VPTTGPQDASTGTLFHTLTATTLPTALKTSGANGYLAGTAASQLDFQNTITSRLPLICGPVCQVGHGEAAPGWLLGCRFVWPAQG